MNIFETNQIGEHKLSPKLLIDLEQISEISECVLPGPVARPSMYSVHMRNGNHYLLNVEQGERLIIAWKNFKNQEYARRGY